MSVREVLTSTCDAVHHGYATTKQQRVRLYLMLKAHPEYYSLVNRERGLWLEGLERYGDEQGWLHEEAARRAAQQAARAGIPEQEV